MVCGRKRKQRRVNLPVTLAKAMKTKFLLLFLLIVHVYRVQGQAYKTLHQEAIVVDSHNDVLSTATLNGLSIEKNLKGRTHSDLSRFFEGGIDVQVFSIFCNEQFGADTAFKFANIEIDSLYALIQRNPQKMMLVTSPATLQQSVQQGKLGCMIGVEGGHMIEDKISYLDSLFNRGARYLTLTWNNSTTWASSAKDETNKEAGANGLTPFGIQIVKRMNSLGMMIDLSHAGEKTFWDVLRLTKKPVLVSHSSAYTLCPVFRNLKDDQIKAIAANNGVIQVNFYPGFLDPQYNGKRKQINIQRKIDKDSLISLKWEEKEITRWLSRKFNAEMNKIRPPFSMLLDHIDYMVKLAGIDHVGIGADMDGIESLPQGINGVEDFPKITKGLLKRGYTREEIYKILGGNFIRVFSANQDLQGV